MSNCACGEPLGRKNKSGRCRRCSCRKLYESTEHRAKVAAGMRRYLSCPVARAKHVEASARRLATWRATPEGQAHVRSSHPPEQRFAIAQKISDTKLAHIPAPWRPRYRELLAKHHYADRARRKVFAEIAASEAADRERLAAMSPFERQMERLRNGAKLVERVAMPVRQYAYSLTGGSL